MKFLTNIVNFVIGFTLYIFWFPLSYQFWRKYRKMHLKYGISPKVKMTRFQILAVLQIQSAIFRNNALVHFEGGKDPIEEYIYNLTVAWIWGELQKKEKK